MPIYRGREVTGFTQDDTGVDVELADGESLRAQYLVGCDGGRSLVRKKAGIDFPGWDPSVSYLIAEVEMTEEPPWACAATQGIHAIGQLDDGKRVRVVLSEKHVGHGDEPTLRRAPRGAHRRLRHGLRRAQRDVDLAVHRHGPAGGVLPRAARAPRRRRRARALARRRQGLNIGVQDAVNLGWKLAQVVHGTSPESLLDTYHAERHPVGARVLQRHDGADRARPRRRRASRPCASTWPSSSAWTSRASATPR